MKNRVYLIVLCIASFFTSQTLYAQDGSSGNPFTSLGHARGVTTAGVYYFNVGGVSFSTYVDASGYIMIINDFSDGVTGISQLDNISTSIEGILSTSVLAKMNTSAIDQLRITSTVAGTLDATTTDATLLGRISTNTTLHKGGNDNTYNNGWTGTGAGYITIDAGGCNNATTALNEVIIHTACTATGMHWIPKSAQVQLQNSVGNIASGNAFRLWVRPIATLGILSQPSTTAQNICSGGSPTPLSVTASGASTYQWYSNTSPSNSGGTLIAGATSSSYTPSNSVAGPTYYYVYITGSGSNITSNVSGAVTVGTSPTTAVAGPDQAASSLCDLTTTTLAANTPSVGTGAWTIVSGSGGSFANASLPTTSFSGTAGTSYTLRWTTTNGSCTSSDDVNIAFGVNPAITIHPSILAQTFCSGAGTLSVEANEGAGSISSYTWYSNAASSNSGGTLLSTTSTSSSTSSYSPLSSAYYYAVVTNSFGCTDVSNVSAAISVVASPSISSQPSASAQNLCLNASPTALSVSASAGSGSVKTYKWYSNTSNSTSGGTLVSTTTTSATTNSYTPSTATAGTKYYYCIITNTNDCSITSTVSGAITVATSSVAGTATAASSMVASGGTTTLSLSGYSGNIQWQQSADGSTSWSNVSGGSGATSATYTTAALSAILYYRAAVTNSSCSVAYSNVISISQYGVTTVTSFSPESGTTGSTITITGTNFSSTYSNNVVYFGATKAVVNAGTTTSLNVTVPIGASYKPITVLNTESKLIGASARPFKVTFTGAISATMFDARVDITHNEQQYRIGLGDFNNDGLADLAVPGNNTGNIAVFKNQSTNGSLSFASRSNFGTTGTGQNDLTVADFNGDGKLDMVSASKAQGSIYILINNTTTATISFGTPITYAPGASQDPPGIAVDDFDKDGKMDIVVASGYNQIKVYRNSSTSGSTSFSLSNTLTTGSFVYAISTADLNGDNYPEILTANVDGNSVSVFRNTSTTNTPNFDTKVDFTLGGSPRWVAVGDMDGDNKVDLVTTNYNNTATVLLNQISSSSGGFSSSSFATKYDLTAPAQANGLAINDLDGDGIMDIALVGTSPKVISIIKNNSTSGSLSFASKIDFTGNSGFTQFNAHIADFDGDGRSDVITGGWGGLSIYRYGCVAPTITTQPSTTAQNLCLNGSPTAFSVNATTSVGTISGYQWYSNSNSSNSGGTLISGATSNSYTPLTTQAGSLYYYCVITNSSGCTKTSDLSGLVTVSSSSVAGTISGAGSVTSGTNSTILTLSGYTGSIQWQSSINNSSYSNISGATSSTYTATNLTSTTFYKVVVTNGACAAATSTNATITTASASTAFSITGSTDANTMSNNVATIVDPNIVVVANGTITGFTVTITSDYTDGDILGYTGSLPSGVNASAFDVTARSLYFTGAASAAAWQTLLRTVTLTSTSNCYPTNRKVSFLPSNKYYNYFNGHYYEYVPTGVSWTTAKSAAASRSFYGRRGYLVTISSEAENNYIWKLISHDSWIGASCIHTEINSALGYNKYGSTTYGQFYWVTGPEKGQALSNGLGASLTAVPGVYNNWSPQEPNNYKGWGENSGHMLSGSGYWNDYKKEGANNGRNPIPYIVEYGGTSGDDTSVAIAFTRDIIISGSPAGTVSGAATVCDGTNSTTLTYSGGGTIQNWEYSTDNFSTAGVSVASTASSISVSNITASRYYRAVVNTAGCASLPSSAALIDVVKTTSGTITAISADVCAGGNALLSLNGQSGSIQKWQVSTSSDFSTGVTDINNTTPSLSHTLSSNGSYYFRAAVLNNVCSGGATAYTEAYPITVTSGTPPVGGSVNSEVYCGGSNAGTLSLSGATGTSYQWEVSTDGGIAWSNESSTSTTQAYTGISSTTKYRVLVTSGSCGSVYSSVGTISIGGGTAAQWTGTVSTDWGNTDNWCGYIIGDDGLDVEIKSNATYAPTLDRSRSIGNLNFNGAGKAITLGNFTLTATSFTGANSSNYVKSTGNGGLKLPIGAGITTTVPIGNSAYNPVSITNNNSISDYFTTKVLDEVYANSVSGTVSSNGRVKRTWDISKTNNNTGAGVNLVFNWNAGETTGLSTPSLFHYESGNWVKQNGTTAFDASSLTYTGYTGTLSSFAILQGIYSWSTAGVNNLWNNANNWSTGVVPGSDAEIVISSGSPEMNIDYAVGGTLTLSGTGSLTINAGKTFSIAAGGVVDFGGKQVTFKSSQSGTAQLGTVAGTLSNATNVVVERFIPASNRAFRFLSPAVTSTTSIRENWMEGATPDASMGYPFSTQSVYNPNPGYGTLITGLNGASNGFDPTQTNNPSLFTFNNSTQAWAAVTNTNGTLTAGTPYRMLIRGDRSYSILSKYEPPHGATTLRTTGTMVTGTLTSGIELPALSQAADGWSLVGNPYQAAVDMTNAGVVKTNLTGYYYIWDPKQATRGAYVAYNLSANASNNINSAMNRYLQPGQAFFVQNSVAGSNRIQFQETAKADASNQSGTHGKLAVSYPSLSAILYYTDSLANGAAAMDATRVLFDASFNNAVDQQDGKKFTNLDETIAIRRGTNSLSMELRGLPDTNTVLPIYITQYRAQQYTLRLKWDQLLANNGLIAYVNDKYKNKTTAIKENDFTNIVYTIDTVAASAAADRFEIVFKNAPSVPTPVTTLGVNEFVKLYPNPVKSLLNVYFDVTGQRAMTLKVYDLLGRKMVEKSGVLNGASINLNQLKQGVYHIQLLDNKNRILYIDKFIKE